MDSLFGTTLKNWRATRRRSQLDLGLDAEVSARHISFLETGRATPSREMVLRLSEALDIPRDSRNILLNNAGFAPVYQNRSLEDADLTQVSEAIDWMISRHDPYPAPVFDQLWNVVRANKTGMATLFAYGIGVGDNLLDALIGNGNGRQIFENWPEVATHMIHRLRAESAHMGGSAKLDSVVEALMADPEVQAFQMPHSMPAVIPARYRIQDQVLSMFTTIAQFSTAEDITLSELRIELMFPADEATKLFLHALS